jgi:hypothetical protein
MIAILVSGEGRYAVGGDAGGDDENMPASTAGDFDLDTGRSRENGKEA